MKVRIIKCSKEDAWYKNQIGNILEVSEYISEYNRYNYEIYLVSKSHVALYINKDDCELVKEVNHGTEELNKLSELFKNMTPEEYKKLYDEAHYKPKVRIPDENTPVDTLVRCKESEKRHSWLIRYFHSISEDGMFTVFEDGRTSKNFNTTKNWKLCEIIEETLEEKRKRIFHKFVPEEFKWYAVDKDGEAYYFTELPYKVVNVKGINRWQPNSGFGLRAGFADPYDWENSLIGREG